ncbi:Hypothetical predicted protein [Paramuricea clavata]|uniref:Uncharacterized protein n=1 Tax=Paramuricea clavata TaxID=317549 RepID=A0A6S7I948_PARCT|nr:Hypothetical predicted protein [Paramuricea clavata]
MSILMGYDYFENNDLEKKVADMEKIQQGNTAEIQKNKTELIDLNDIGRNTPLQYDLTQLYGYPPGFLETTTVSATDQKNAKFIIFKVSGVGINQETQSPTYGFYGGSTGNVVMFTETQTGGIVRTTFTFFYMSTKKITIFGLKFRNIDTAGNSSVRKKSTVLKCFLVT